MCQDQSRIANHSFCHQDEPWELGPPWGLVVPLLDWVATAERSPRVKLPWDPAVPQAFLNFPYSLFHSNLFSTISSIHHFRSTIFHYFPRVANMRSAATRNGLGRKVEKWFVSTRNGTAVWELHKLHKVGKWHIWTLTHQLSPCKSI